jgi:hypothetical protein
MGIAAEARVSLAEVASASQTMAVSVRSFFHGLLRTAFDGLFIG